MEKIRVLAENPVEKIADKSNRPQEMLAELGIAEGEPIPSQSLRELIIRHEQEIVDGITRNFYGEIKRSFVKRAQAIRTNTTFFRKQNEYTARDSDTQHVDVICYMQTNAHGFDAKRNQLGEYQLVFTFEASTE